MFVVEKYKNKWAVLDTADRVWYFVKGGRKACLKLCEELNKRSF